jgi:hypothetical protein
LEKIAALYLAHLNPVTKAHEIIISNLAKQYKVYVFPVIFRKAGNEVNTRTFPFPYDVRREMLKSLFEQAENVEISPDYFFESPFIKYVPPFLSPYSWILRKQIFRNIKEKKYISYTGDTAERIALTVYNLHPIQSNRLKISASKVKELIYEAVMKDNTSESQKRNEGDPDWEDLVPNPVAEIIKRHWDIVERFARMTDKTVKILGMKFPAEGIFHF